jgi:hypothetical protein
MSIRGTVKDGVVVLPKDVQLPNGAEVEVVVSEEGPTHEAFFKLIEKLAKPRPHLPDDYSLNHGYYVDGEPRRE